MIKYYTVQELIDMIDSHLALQMNQEPARPSSRGTMFVDWDGHGFVVSYRNDGKRKHKYPPSSSSRPDTPPLLVNHDSMQVKYRPDSGGSRQYRMWIEGYDLETAIQYDYDGEILHLHRDDKRPRSSSRLSDYYAVDAREYETRKGVRVVDKELPPTPAEKRRSKVVRLVCRLLRKIEGLGLLGKFGGQQGERENSGERRERRREGVMGAGADVAPWSHIPENLIKVPKRKPMPVSSSAGFPASSRSADIPRQPLH
ncbi:hypothetical protein CC78DRAFT_40383 [Lojkania enalia]|uniref:Uncharacterized protein n=1 Tax=Lojkania enalia TaxID=147567 RepID=A0A9P4MWC5_9PLEO|nr:hypothetical protein CC78DRAFT_40383 [Didymosphaeria enalia]